MKDRLIELLDKKIATIELEDSDSIWTSEKLDELADHLLSYGVIVPPVKVGQTVYSVVDNIDRAFKGEVYEIVIREGHIFFRYVRHGYYTGGADINQIGKTIFLTEKEAEKALAERSKE